MNPKHTWTWLIVAGALFAFIFFFERHWGRSPAGPPPLLPGLKADTVTGLIVRPAGQREFRAEFTNGLWWITQPFRYPAQKTALDALLAGLEQLIPATTITRGELSRLNADEEFGLEDPQTALVIQQPDSVTTIKFGRLTAPGNQVYAQVVGREDIYVLDAEVLRVLPGTDDDWRDRTLVDLRPLKFDGISITNAGRAIKLRASANGNWRLSDPLRARANGPHLRAMQRQLEATRVTAFVSDERRTDLDTLGLQPPDLSIAFTDGPATVLLLQFGKTNAAGHCFARRDDLDPVITVPAEALAAWRRDFFAFRDRQLVAIPPDLTALEMRGPESFTLERGSNSWRVAGEKFPVDPDSVRELLERLGSLEIMKFEKDVITAAEEFGAYGLTAAVHQVIFKTAASAGDTNAGSLELSFGATNDELLYARRSDEASVYAVRLADFQTLPVAGWQLRDRRVWSFAPEELVRLTLRKGDWTRGVFRGDDGAWALAEGSQGVVEVECLEVVVELLGQLNALPWVARGAAAGDAKFGFTPNGLRLALELKSGRKLELELGGYSSAQYHYARVLLDEEPWVFEFSLALHRFLSSCFGVPPGGN